MTTVPSARPTKTRPLFCLEETKAEMWDPHFLSRRFLEKGAYVMHKMASLSLTFSRVTDTLDTAE